MAPGRTGMAAAESSSAAPGKRTLVDGLGSSASTSHRPTAFAAYLYIHGNDLKRAIGAQLADTVWPDPAPELPWAQGGDRMFARDLAHRVGVWLDGGGAFAPLVHPSHTLKSFEQYVAAGGLAHANWSPAFGEALAQLVERSAIGSLTTRVGPRYRAALAQMFRLPRAAELIAGHPIDPLVAAALTRPGILDTSEIVALEDQGPPKLAQVQARWLGRAHPELWNFVEVTPASASVEDVAASLWGDPTKSTMAYAIRKIGGVFRIAPAHARQVIAARYRGELVGTSDTDEDHATQLVALARSNIGKQVAARQFEAPQAAAGRRAGAAHRREERQTGAGNEGKLPGKQDDQARASAPSTAQLVEIERAIGGLLDAMRVQVAPVGLVSVLEPAYEARAERAAQLAEGDEPTRAQWLPGLQFQHAQLLTIAPRIAPLVQRLRPIQFLPPTALDAAQRAQRDQLRQAITEYLQAAAVSHLRDASTAILRGIGDREHAAKLDALDAAHVDMHDATRQAIDSRQPSVRGTAEVDDAVAAQRQAALTGRGQGKSPYEHQKATTSAGEIALAARMRAVEHALDQLRAAANAAGFDDPNELRKWLPNTRPLPEVLADVQDRLAEVDRTWQAATRDGTPVVQEDGDAPADWGDWQGRAAGLAAARTAFAAIAGDQRIGDFLRKAAAKIRHQQMVTAITNLAKTLLITLATGMGAAALGRAAATMLAGEATGLTASGIALVADVSINASLNTVVQLALSDGQGSAGWMLLENGLMELFTRGLGHRLRVSQSAVLAEARELAQLPNLSAIERRALGAVDFAGAQLVADFVGGMATQWAAHRLVQTFQTSRNEVTEPFAHTVLQQGAAIGLGKFFHGRLEAWKRHRASLEKLGFGQLPEARALFAAREQFYAQAKALADSPSPDPAAGHALEAQNAALIRQERVLLGARRAPAAPVGAPEAGEAHAQASDPHRGAAHDGRDRAEHAYTAERSTGSVADGRDRAEHAPTTEASARAAQDGRGGGEYGYTAERSTGSAAAGRDRAERATTEASARAAQDGRGGGAHASTTERSDGSAHDARGGHADAGHAEQTASGDAPASVGRSGSPASATDIPDMVVLAGDDGLVRELARRVKPLAGYIDVIVHGDANSFLVIRDDVDIRLDQRSLATYLRKHGLAGQKIRLIACEAGRTPFAVARHLANKLHVEVLAPNLTAWIDGDGNVGVGRRGRHEGKWIPFEPKESSADGAKTRLRVPEEPHVEPLPDAPEHAPPLDVRFDHRLRYDASHHAELQARLGKPLAVGPDMVDGVRVVVARRPSRFGVDYDVTQVLVGPKALAADVLAHAELIRLVERYNGLVGKLRLLWHRLRGTDGKDFERTRYPHGSRGWVLANEIEKIGRHIVATQLLRDAGQVDAARAQSEIEFLQGAEAYFREQLRDVTAQGGAQGGDPLFDMSRPDVGETTKQAEAAGYKRPGQPGAELAGAKLDPDAYYYRRSTKDPGMFELARKPGADGPQLEARVVGGRFVGIQLPKQEAPRRLADLERGNPLEVLYAPEGTMAAYAAMLERTGLAPRSVVDGAALYLHRKLSEQPNATVDVWRHAVKQHFRQRVLDRMLDPSLDAGASYRRMREMVDGLGNADRGLLTEEWYRGRYAPDAKGRTKYDVARTSGVNKGKTETRVTDLIVDGEIREVKDIEGPIDQEQFGAYVDMLRDDQLSDSMGVKRLRYVFTKPKGAIANLEFFAGQFDALEIGRRLSVEVFDARGNRRVVRSAEQARNLLASMKGFL